MLVVALLFASVPALTPGELDYVFVRLYGLLWLLLRERNDG